MRRRKIIFAILVIAFLSVTSVKAFSKNEPFSLRLISKPTTVVPGNTYKIRIEVKNRTEKPLTLSSLGAIGVGFISWRNNDGSEGGGMGFGHGEAKLIIGTNYDPKTGKFTCVYSHYDKDDFFTLPVGGGKQFDVDFEIPGEIKAPAIVIVHIDFESQYDGSEIGLNAWTSKARTLTVKIRAKKVA